MFNKIKNLFRKKEENIVSAITIYTNEDYDVFVDIKMCDSSEKSIDHLSSLMTMFNSANFFKVSSVLKHQCTVSDNDDLYVNVIQKTVSKMGVENFLNDYKENQDKPCVNPSEML